jgi:gamma-D-glutamyl-L-lysine dipeptidyl-peptidase
MVLGCAVANAMNAGSAQDALDALQRVQDKFAPDRHMAIFEVTAQIEGSNAVVKGEVDNVAAKEAALAAVKTTGFGVSDQITVLPEPSLGDRVWGLATISLVNLREKPGNASEMGTQAFMGSVLRVWKTKTNWFLVQTSDHYLGWTEGGSFVACTKEESDAWQAGPLLIITALEERILEKPSEDAPPVSDVVQCDLVKRVSTEGPWFKVALPDGRTGYVPTNAAADFAVWQKERQPTAENIERTARIFMGRPYFWGCNSARGFDCSGFTQLVFFLNGLELSRNAA